jgi:hypothetical protein
VTGEDTYAAYTDAWNETEAVRRKELLARCLTADAFVAYPTFAVIGHDEVATKIDWAQQQVPGLRFRQTSGIEYHNGWL